MGTRIRVVLMLICVAVAGSWGTLSAQTPAPASSGQRVADAAALSSISSATDRINSPTAPAGGTSTAGASAGGAQVVAPVLLPASEKKHALELEADRLVAMATELKARVNKTNKNILSLTVVEQAEEIEHYAHQLKSGEKK